MSIGSLVEEYLADCRRRGLSTNTVDYAYGYPLRHVFLHWCSCVGIGDPRRLTSWLLDRFVGELLIQGGKAGPVARQSVITYVRTFNQLLAWAARAGALDAPRERDKLIVRLLADTGIRLGEVVSLRPDNITGRNSRHYLHPTRKGQRDRLAPLAPTLNDSCGTSAQRGRVIQKWPSCFWQLDEVTEAALNRLALQVPPR
jgi:site-specific recombinase XerD